MAKNKFLKENLQAKTGLDLSICSPWDTGCKTCAGRATLCWSHSAGPGRPSTPGGRRGPSQWETGGPLTHHHSERLGVPSHSITSEDYYHELYFFTLSAWLGLLRSGVNFLTSCPRLAAVPIHWNMDRQDQPAGDTRHYYSSPVTAHTQESSPVIDGTYCHIFYRERERDPS